MSPNKEPLPNWVVLLAWFISACVAVFLILGWAGVFNGGNIDRECYDFQLPNGDMGNSCDQLGEG